MAIIMVTSICMLGLCGLYNDDLFICMLGLCGFYKGDLYLYVRSVWLL